METKHTGGEWRPGRRVNVELPGGGRIGFSVAHGVDEGAVRAEVLKVLEAGAKGHHRRVRSIDGPQTLGESIGYGLLGLKDRAEQAVTIAWRATFGRQKVRAEIADFRRALTPTAAIARATGAGE